MFFAKRALKWSEKTFGNFNDISEVRICFDFAPVAHSWKMFYDQLQNWEAEKIITDIRSGDPESQFQAVNVLRRFACADIRMTQMYNFDLLSCLI